MPKKFFFIFVSFLTLSCFLIGFFAGKTVERKVKQIDITKLEEEKGQLKRFAEYCFPPLPTEIKNIQGKITKIKDNNIEIEALIRISQFPLGEGKDMEKKNIKVNITDKTQFYKIELSPSPKEIISQFKDVQLGDNIVVFSEENMAGKDEINALKIQLLK